jgi:hypothetical protein
MKVIRMIYICLLFGFIFSETLPSDTIILTFKPNGGNEDFETLQKEKSIKVDASDYMITFNCKDFKDGEEMYFKIKAYKGTFYYQTGYNGVFYQYIDGNHGYDESKLRFAEYQFETDYETLPSGEYQIKYFTITKKKSEFEGTNGELLLIYFNIDHGPVEITNTLEDEGKFETWKIVVIVVAVVLVAAVFIGCFCYRRKKQLAMRNQNAGTVGVNQYNNAQYAPQYNNAQYDPQYNNAQYDPQYNQPISNYEVNQPSGNYAAQY